MSLRFQRSVAVALVPLLSLSLSVLAGCAASGTVSAQTHVNAAAVPAETKPAPAEEPSAPSTPPTPSASEETEAAQPALSAIIAEARERGAPILLYVKTTWCEPCKIIEEKVLPAPEVGKALEGWRFQKYDAEKDAGADVALRFRVRTFPTLLLLSPDGAEVDRIIASTDPSHFADQIRRLEEPARKGPLADGQARTEADPRRLLAAAHVAERADRPVAARAFYKGAMRADRGGHDGAGPEAATALMKLNARIVVRKDHATRLRRNLERYPESAAAGPTLEGLAALAPESLPVSKVTVRRAGNALLKHRANDAWGLDRLALALDRLGDAELAAVVRTHASQAPRPELQPLQILSATRLRDPLEPDPMEILQRSIKVKQ